VRDRLLPAAGGAGFAAAMLGGIAPALIALCCWLQATWRDAGRGRWAGAGAVIAVIAVFASTYPVSTSEQLHRTINSFLFFMLSNPYVLTAIAVALA
jgi:hypothetical protein